MKKGLQDALRNLGSIDPVRLPLFCALAALSTMIITAIGWLLWIDYFVSDQIYYSKAIEPAGQVVIIHSDETTVAANGRYPFDRAMLAEALERMNRAGVQRVYIDSTLSHSANRDEDDALEAVLQQFGPNRVALPIVRKIAGTHQSEFSMPLPRFARHASLANLNAVFDSDRRIRDIGPMLDIPGHSAADWLVGSQRDVSQPLKINYAIDLAKIPAFNLLDVAGGRVPDTAFAGKMVVFGVKSLVVGQVADVPIFGQVSRPELVALAAETLLQTSPMIRLTMNQNFLFLFMLALAVSLVLQHLRPVSASLAFTVAVVGVSVLAVILWRVWGVMLNLIPTFMVVSIVWQRAFMRTSPLGRMLWRLRNAVVGIDHASLMTAIEAMGEPAVLFDRQGRILGSNQAFSDLHQIIAPEVNDEREALAVFGADADAILRAFESGDSTPLLIRTSRNDKPLYFEVRIRQILTPVGLIGIAGLTDVSQAKAREAQLQTLAFADPLTGLTNRLAFQARLESRCSAPEGAAFAAMLIDLDGFKAVNDTLGHDAGDQLLKGVAERLRSCCSEDEVVARLGGDEFALLLNTPDTAAAVDRAQAIVREIMRGFDIDGQDAHVGASIGVAMFPADETDGRALLKLADAAMYRAKAVKPAVCAHRGEPVREQRAA